MGSDSYLFQISGLNSATRIITWSSRCMLVAGMPHHRHHPQFHNFPKMIVCVISEPHQRRLMTESRSNQNPLDPAVIKSVIKIQALFRQVSLAEVTFELCLELFLFRARVGIADRRFSIPGGVEVEVFTAPTLEFGVPSAS